MTIKYIKSNKGFTLIEVMAAVLVLMVTMLGTAAFRYYAALDVREAALRKKAAEVGLLLCETWQGVKGLKTYDPVAGFGSDLTITTAVNPPAFESGDFTLLETYSVEMDGFNCYAILSWKDINTEMRALNVIVAWPMRGCEQSTIADDYRLLNLTTYTLISNDEP